MNYIKLNIGGKERGAKLGLGFLDRVQKEEGLTFDEVLNKANTPTLLFHSLAYNVERSGEKLDFNKHDVYDWLDEIGLQSPVISEFQIAFFNSLKTHLDAEGQKAITKVVAELEGKTTPQKKVAKN